MPTDITGTEVIQEDKLTGERVFRFVPGPIFANIIPRRRDQPDPAEDAGGPPRGDAGARRHSGRPHLPPSTRPFSCSRHRTPSSRRGPTRCPRRSSDRFMFDLRIHYPDAAKKRRSRPLTQEVQDIPDRAGGARFRDHRTAAAGPPHPGSPFDRELRRSPGALDPAAGGEEQAGVAKKYISWGAGPRASQYLVLGGQGARPVFRGAPMPTMQDIHDIAPSIPRPPDRDQLRRRGRGPEHARRHRRTAQREQAMDLEAGSPDDQPPSSGAQGRWR